jgi:hypothetical protein
MIAMPCSPMLPENDDPVAGAGAVAGPVLPLGDDADAGRRDIDAVALALLHHLGVAGDDGNLGSGGRQRHRVDNARQIAERESFLENEARRQVERRRAHHRDVVDRPVYRQAADVAAGEEQRPDDMRIGGQHQPAGGHRQHRRVVALPEIGIAQPAGEQLVDQLRHRASAAAVGHVDPALPQIERACVALAQRIHGATAASAKRPKE